MKKWENNRNVESEDGTWEITNWKEHEIVELQFWDYSSQNTPNEELEERTHLYLRYDQFKSLLHFMNQMNKEE